MSAASPHRFGLCRKSRPSAWPCASTNSPATSGNLTPEDPRRARRPVLALERRNVTIVLDDGEREHLKAQTHEAGTRLAQYIRTLCGFALRNTSLPGTEERDLEEEDAWERLKRLGLNPREYFPADM